jgi:phage replication O-like protein O
MMFQHTQIPNTLFDKYLPQLKESELKVLLVVLRQTFGWIDTKTGNRKIRDRISRTQFIQKTGLSCKIVSKAIKSLVDKRLLTITDQIGNLLHTSEERKGKNYIFYAFQPGHFETESRVNSAPTPGYNCTHNKRNYTKENITKGSRLPIRQNTTGTIEEIIEQSKYQPLLRF